MAVIVIVPISVASRIQRTGSIVQGGGIPRLILFWFSCCFSNSISWRFLLLNTCLCQSSISWLAKIAFLFSPQSIHILLLLIAQIFYWDLYLWLFDLATDMARNNFDIFALIIFVYLYNRSLIVVWKFFAHDHKTTTTSTTRQSMPLPSAAWICVCLSVYMFPCLSYSYSP